MSNVIILAHYRKAKEIKKILSQFPDKLGEPLKEEKPKYNNHFKEIEHWNDLKLAKLNEEIKKVNSKVLKDYKIK